MKPLTFTAAFGDRVKTVVLSCPSGGAGGYQIVIDRMYHGMLVKLSDVWVGHLNRAGDITPEEIEILGDIIDENSSKIV